MFGQFYRIAKQSVSEWSEDKATRLAASLAYYTMLSIAPLLIISIKIIGVIFGAQAARGGVSQYLSQTVGPKGATAAEDMIKNAGQSGSGVLATIISTVILIFSASGVFGELQDSLNTIWEVKPKPDRGWKDMIRERFFSFALVLGVVFLLLVTLIINTALSALTHALDGQQAVWQTVNFVISMGVIICLFALIFKYLPDAEVRWRYVWLGAIVTGILFTIGKFALGWYLGRASTTSVYGAAGSLVALLIWVYYSAQILFFGAEFTQVYAKLQGYGIRPADNAVVMSEEERTQRGAPHKETVLAAADPSRKRPAIYRPATVARREERRSPWLFGTIGLATGAAAGGLATWLINRDPRIAQRRAETQERLRQRIKEIESEIGSVRRFEHSARAKHINDRIDEMEQRVYDAVRSNAAPSTPKVWWNKFVEGWKHGAHST